MVPCARHPLKQLAKLGLLFLGKRTEQVGFHRKGCGKQSFDDDAAIGG